MLGIVMLILVMLSVAMLSVFMLHVVMLTVVALMLAKAIFSTFFNTLLENGHIEATGKEGTNFKLLIFSFFYVRFIRFKRVTLFRINIATVFTR